MARRSRTARRAFATWRRLLAAPRTPETELLWSDVHRRHPSFAKAAAADARITASNRGDRFEFTSRIDLVIQGARLALVTDAFFGLLCYRAKASLQAKHVPLIPRLLHHMAMRWGHLSIGDPVVLEPGVYIPHGQVVIDGMTTIRSGTVLGPFVTIGLRNGQVLGPTIGPRAYIGTGAKVLGPVTVGAHAQVGANAVVLRDVADHLTVAGIPARPTSERAVVTGRDPSFERDTSKRP